MDFIYGIRPLEEALESGRDLEKVYFQKGLHSPLFKGVFNKVRERGVPFQFVPVQRLNRITSKNHQGVIAWLSMIEYQKIENLLPMIFEEGRVPLLIVLDGITDVRNIGAIMRTADAVGCDAVIVPEKNSAAINADTVKTSAGALAYLPVCREHDLVAVLQYLKNSGLQLVAATEKGADLFTLSIPKGPVAIIMGSEEKGIRPSLLHLADVRVSIPMSGHVASLNVSVAAGIILYEVLRQRSNNS